MAELLLRPVPDFRGPDHHSGDPAPPWGRDEAIHDLTRSDWRRRGTAERAENRVASYFTNATLGATDQGALTATDSLGHPIAIPNGLVAMRLVHIERPRAYVTPAHNCWPESSWLAFAGEDGVTRLLLPGYGWDPIIHLRNQITPATSLELAEPYPVYLESKWSAVERTYPGWTSSVFVPLGGGPKTVTAWSRRLDEDLRFA